MKQKDNINCGQLPKEFAVKNPRIAVGRKTLNLKIFNRLCYLGHCIVGQSPHCSAQTLLALKEIGGCFREMEMALFSLKNKPRHWLRLPPDNRLIFHFIKTTVLLLIEKPSGNG